MVENKNTILLLKMKSGEEIVSEVLPSEDNNSPTIAITNPMEIVVLDDTSAGTTGFSFREWIPQAFITDDAITLRKDDMYCILNPSQQLLKFYTRITANALITKERVKKAVPPMDDDEETDEAKTTDESLSDTREEPMTKEELFTSLLKALPKQTLH